jgi:thioredoxin-like negative regulator of GroEL
MKYPKLIALLIVGSFMSTALHGQGWLHNLKIAQTVAQEKKQLILVDFWATWCGPCKQMDNDVWSTAEAEAIKKNFVPVKIDIDAERTLATKYNVRSIPMLILMTHEGEVIHTYTGYSGRASLMDFISKIPANAEALYKKDPTSTDGETFEQALILGLAMQELSQQTDHTSLQRSFLAFSDKSFKKASKLAGDNAVQVNETVLLTTLNKVYRNTAKKAIKEIEENRAQYEGTPSAALMYYVLLKAHKAEGNTPEYELALSKLREQQDSQKYLALVN